MKKIITIILTILLLSSPIIFFEDTVTATEINIDGDISDWNGIPPLIIDTKLDNKPEGTFVPDILNSDDIKEVYMTNNSTNIFLLIKVNRSGEIDHYTGEEVYTPLFIYIDSNLDGKVNYSIPIYNTNLHYTINGYLAERGNMSAASIFNWNNSITTDIFKVGMYQDFVAYNFGQVGSVEVFGNGSYIEVAIPKLWNPNTIGINVNSLTLGIDRWGFSGELPDDAIVKIPKYILIDRCPDSGFTSGEVHSPIDIHIYDDEGNHVGNNYETGELEEEIDGLNYHVEDGAVKSFFSYNNAVVDRVELAGTGDGHFVFESAVTTYSSSSDFIYSMVIGDCISTGQIIEYDYPIYTLEGHPHKIHYINNSQGQWIPHPWKTTIDFNLVNVLSEPITTMNYVNTVSNDWEYYDHSFLIEYSDGETYEICNVKSTYSDIDNKWTFDFSESYIQKNSQKTIQLNGIQPGRELIIKMKYQLPTLLSMDISEIIEDNTCINEVFSVEFEAHAETATKYYIKGTDTNTIEYQFMN